MDIQEIRRSNLRKWVGINGTPQKEKSYFSQLLSGESSFGERAARRLERDYKIGEGFLDKGNERTNVSVPINSDDSIDPKELIKLIELYGKSTRTGRAHIIEAAEVAERIPSVRKRKAAKE